jgi:hypothetical protein
MNTSRKMKNKMQMLHLFAPLRTTETLNKIKQVTVMRGQRKKKVPLEYEDINI